MLYSLTVFRKQDPNDFQKFTVRSRFSFIAKLKSLKMLARIFLIAKSVYLPEESVSELKATNFRERVNVNGETEAVSDIETNGIYLFSVAQNFN